MFNKDPTLWPNRARPPPTFSKITQVQQNQKFANSGLTINSLYNQPKAEAIGHLNNTTS